MGLREYIQELKKWRDEDMIVPEEIMPGSLIGQGMSNHQSE